MEVQVKESTSGVVIVRGESRYPLRRPKIKSVKSLEISLKEPGVSHFDVIGDFLKELGLPTEVFDDLEVDQCETIVEAVCKPASKKN